MVVDPKPDELGARMQDRARYPSAAKALGHEGYERVKGIRWEPVIEALVGE